MADRAELVLQAVELPGAPRAPLRRAPRVRPARLPAQRDARVHPQRARGLLDQPRADARRLGHPVPDPRGRLVVAAPRRHVGPGRRQDLRLVRRAHQLHHGRRLPGRPRGIRALVAGRPARHRQGHRPLPHDLLAGDALERGPRAAAPGLGPRLAARRGRRADEQEPRQLPRSRRLRGRVRAGRRPLRRAARGPVRPRRRGVVGLVRPPLQRRPRQRLRQPRQPHGQHGQPLPRRRAARSGGRRGRPALAAWAGVPERYAGARGRLPPRRGARRAHRHLRAAANKMVDAARPWDLAKAAKAGDEAATTQLRDVLGDLVEACRADRPRGHPVHARAPARESSPSSASSTRTRPTATAARRSSRSWRGAAMRGRGDA